MAIDFPDSPSVGDQYIASGKTYQWDGTVWTIYGPQTNPNIFKVDTSNNRVGIGTTSPTTALDVNGDATAGKFLASGSEANLMPSGTTAERPGSPAAGMFRFNTTTGEPEWYHANAGWLRFRNGPTISVSYLVVAGGGGGGWHQNAGGGGGAGGLRSSQTSTGGGGSVESTLSLDFSTSYTVSVGAGGAAATAINTPGGQGDDSTFATITSAGGGGGGGGYTSTAGAATSGGSGGGAWGIDSGMNTYGNVGASGTAFQGFAGGNQVVNGGYGFGGGGGGASESGNTDGQGEGGDGVINNIIDYTLATTLSIGEVVGSNVYYAGGGGGGKDTRGGGTAGSGGTGGGGQGAGGSTARTATSGTANTGGGAGGAAAIAPTDKKNGGSGVVIIRYSSDRSITVSAGLTSTTTTVGSDKVTIFTAGTGTVSWA